MRITLTLDKDVYRRLVSATRRTGRSFQEVVNESLRKCLAAEESMGPNRFRVSARFMGLRPGIDLSNIEGLLDVLDGPMRLR